MRAPFSIISLCAIGASAAIISPTAEIEARQNNSAIWYFITYDALCGFGGCYNADYVVFGAANTVPGAPAFAARGSYIHASFLPSSLGPLTINQTFTIGGKNTTVTGVSDWSGTKATSFTIPVSITA
ncbi:hypothetical protein GGR51DRAFT_561437 [Nemania sp. FL0031]|nr:hypothetical protein GGR51DRAFT_561437 [Nemania sp. FL0031]